MQVLLLILQFLRFYLCIDEMRYRSCVFIFFTAQPGIGFGNSDSQLGCSFHDDFTVLEESTVSNLSTVRFLACWQCLQPLRLAH